MSTLNTPRAVCWMICLLIATLSPSAARAQAPDSAAAPTAEQQELARQMQEVREQVFRNMIVQGIDPREFFEEVRQASADGSFDLDIVRQKLIEKGLLDKESADRVESTMQKAGNSTLKRQLNVSDEEWNVLQVRIQKVVDAACAAGVPQQQFMMLGLRPTHKGLTETAKAMQALRAASKDPATPPQDVAAKLEAWRNARRLAQDQYAAAQKELVEVLTRRQEGVLLLVGLLQ